MNKLTLTKRQAQCLDIIASSVAERGFPPTLREIGDLMGIRSTNGVYDHLRALERKGYISHEQGISRGLRILVETPGLTRLDVRERELSRIQYLRDESLRKARQLQEELEQLERQAAS